MRRDLLFLALCALVGLVMAGLLWRPPARAAAKIKLTRATDPAELRAVAAQVDAAFASAWREQNLEPLPSAPVLTLARRLSLGLAGTLPSLEEVAVLRQEKPDTALDPWLQRLLEDRRTHAYLAERFARAFVGVEDGPFLIFRRHRLVDWLAAQFQQNRPYDAIVRQLLTAQGLWTTQPEVNFITVTVDQNNKESGPDETKLAGRVARAFLGVRLDCVQCHRDYLQHTWSQQDFHGLAAFFAPADMSLTGVRDRSDFIYQVRYQGRAEPEKIPLRVPFHPELLPEQGEPRTRLAQWVTHPDNAAFARATVNRVWALLFNRPLVEPIDSIPLQGPWPPGLEILATDFARHGYDLHRLIGVIARTRVFQLDSAAPAGKARPIEAQFKHWAAFPITRERPEQVASSVVQAASLRAIDARSHVLFRVIGYFQQHDFVQRYGDPGENEFNLGNLTIPQRLLLMNGKLVRERSEENLVLNAATRISSLAPDDATGVTNAYYCVLTRPPTSPELAYFTQLVQGKTGRARHQAFEDLFWTLLNTTEFSWNH